MTLFRIFWGFSAKNVVLKSGLFGDFFQFVLATLIHYILEMIPKRELNTIS
jgi:hypothetical protein